MTDFEDDLSREYRDIARIIPVELQLGEELSTERWRASLGVLLSYVDLCNEQVFLRQQGRISRATWTNWVDGIKTNLARDGFREAWELIKHSRPGEFAELRQLERERYHIDPRDWVPIRTRIRNVLLP